MTEQLVFPGMPTMPTTETANRERLSFVDEYGDEKRIVVVHTGIQLLDQALNECYATGYYLASAPQVFVVPGVGDALPGVYAMVICELDKERYMREHKGAK